MRRYQFVVITFCVCLCLLFVSNSDAQSNDKSSAPQQLLVIADAAWLYDADDQPYERLFLGDTLEFVDKQDDRYVFDANRGYVRAESVVEIKPVAKPAPRRGRRRVAAAPLPPLQEALLQLESGELEACAKLVNGLLEEDANNTRVLLVRSLLGFEQQQIEAAQADARAVLKLSPTNLQAVLLTIKAWDLQDDHAAILEFIAGLPEAMQNEPELQLEAGYAHYMHDDYPAARKMFNALVEQRPRDSSGWHYLGELAALEGDDPAAIEMFTKAIAWDDEFWNSYFQRGLARARSGQTNAALADFTTVLTDNPLDYCLSMGIKTLAFRRNL